MKPRRWNLLKAAGIGALVGAGYSLLKSITEHQGSPLAYQFGMVVGGVVAGAVLFGLIAGGRNLIVRAE